jgi:hypothetical protein
VWAWCWKALLELIATKKIFFFRANKIGACCDEIGQMFVIVYLIQKQEGADKDGGGSRFAVENPLVAESLPSPFVCSRKRIGK